MSPDAEIPSAAPRALQYHGKKVARYCLNFAQTAAYPPVFGPNGADDGGINPCWRETFQPVALGQIRAPKAAGMS